MNVNEVLANRALELLGEPLGDYARVSPLDDINLPPVHERHLPDGAAARGDPPAAPRWRTQVVALQEAFQAEGEAVRARRQGRPHAVPGRRADHARARDGRLRRGAQPRPLAHLQVRGAPARGQPRRHGHRHRPRRAARSTSSASSTRCASSPASASRAPRTSSRPRRTPTCSSRSPASSRRTPSNLLKICGDLRLLSSGPEAGLGEIRLPRAAGRLVDHARQGQPGDPRGRQPGGACWSWATTPPSPLACGLGSLELNPFLPLVADCLLESLDLLARACEILRRYCVEGIEADEARCAAHVRGVDAPPPRRWCRRSATRRPAPWSRAAAERGRDDPRRRRRRRACSRPSSSTSCSRPRPSAASARPQPLGRPVED